MKRGRIPRKTKKARKTAVLIMDMASIPKEHGFTIETWLYWYNQHGVVWYDSLAGATPIIKGRNTKLKLKER